jgi:hypothetical protein
MNILCHGRRPDHGVQDTIIPRFISARFIDTSPNERVLEKGVRLAERDIKSFSVVEDVWVLSAANMSVHQHRPHAHSIVDPR